MKNLNTTEIEIEKEVEENYGIDLQVQGVDDEGWILMVTPNRSDNTYSYNADALTPVLLHGMYEVEAK